MSSPSDIKKGAVIRENGELLVVTEFQHVNPGKGAAFVRTRVKNVKTGKTLEKTIKMSDAIELVEMEYRNMQFLYHDATGYTFMDTGSYEQYNMNDDELGSDGKFLQEGTVVTMTMYEDRPVALQLPRKMTFIIAETMPAVKGDTASGNVTKEAKTDAGFMIDVPLFIKEGEKVIVNTDSGEYVERA